jgi:hypothetical protein
MDKHVNAHPVIPSICPLGSSQQLVTPKLLNGDGNQDRFSRLLNDVVRDMPDQVNLGAVKELIGSHSNRKGSAIYVLSVCLISGIGVYLRAGWFG